MIVETLEVKYVGSRAIIRFAIKCKDISLLLSICVESYLSVRIGK